MNAESVTKMAVDEQRDVEEVYVEIEEDGLRVVHVDRMACSLLPSTQTVYPSMPPGTSIHGCPTAPASRRLCHSLNLPDPGSPSISSAQRVVITAIL